MYVCMYDVMIILICEDHLHGNCSNRLVPLFFHSLRVLYAVNEFNGFFLKTSFKDANQKYVSGSWSCRHIHIAENSESCSKLSV